MNPNELADKGNTLFKQAEPDNVGPIRKLKLLGEAEASFRAAMDIEPNFQLARIGLTRVEKERVKIAGVVKDYKASLKQDPNGENGLLWFKLGKILQAIGNEKDIKSMKDAFKKAHEINPENERFKTTFDKMNSLDVSSSSSVLTSPIHHTTASKSKNKEAGLSPSKKSQEMLKALDEAAAAMDLGSSDASVPHKKSSPRSPPLPALPIPTLDEDEAVENAAVEFAQRISISLFRTSSNSTTSGAVDHDESMFQSEDGVCVVDGMSLETVADGPRNQPCFHNHLNKTQNSSTLSSPHKHDDAVDQTSLETIWRSTLYDAAGLSNASSYHSKVVASLQQLTDAKHMIYSKKTKSEREQTKEVHVIHTVDPATALSSAPTLLEDTYANILSEFVQHSGCTELKLLPLAYGLPGSNPRETFSAFQKAFKKLMTSERRSLSIGNLKVILYVPNNFNKINAYGMAGFNISKTVTPSPTPSPIPAASTTQKKSSSSPFSPPPPTASPMKVSPSSSSASKVNKPSKPTDTRLEALLKRQHEKCGSILQELTVHGHKTSHWAWWVFPTEMPGASEPPPATSVSKSSAHELLERAPEEWKLVLEKIAELVNSNRSTTSNSKTKHHHHSKHRLSLSGVLPSIDHGRVTFFIRFWRDVHPLPAWLWRVLSTLAEATGEPPLSPLPPAQEEALSIEEALLRASSTATYASPERNQDMPNKVSTSVGYGGGDGDESLAETSISSYAPSFSQANISLTSPLKPEERAGKRDRRGSSLELSFSKEKSSPARPTASTSAASEKDDKDDTQASPSRTSNDSSVSPRRSRGGYHGLDLTFTSPTKGSPTKGSLTHPLKSKQDITSPMAPPRNSSARTSHRASSPLAQRTQALANYKKSLEKNQTTSEASQKEKSESNPEWMTEELLSIQERQQMREKKRKEQSSPKLPSPPKSVLKNNFLAATEGKGDSADKAVGLSTKEEGGKEQALSDPLLKKQAEEEEEANMEKAERMAPWMTRHKGKLGVSPLRSPLAGGSGRDLPPISTQSARTVKASTLANQSLVSMSPIRTAADVAALSGNSQSSDETTTSDKGTDAATSKASVYTSLKREACTTNPLTVFSTETDVDDGNTDTTETTETATIADTVAAVADPTVTTTSDMAESSTEVKNDDKGYVAFERLDNNDSPEEEEDDTIIDVMSPLQATIPAPQPGVEGFNTDDTEKDSTSAKKKKKDKRDSPKKERKVSTTKPTSDGSGLVEWDDLGQPFSPTQSFKVQEKGIEEAELKLLDEKHAANKKPGLKGKKKGKGTFRELSDSNDLERIGQAQEDSAVEAKRQMIKAITVASPLTGSVQWDDMGNPFTPTQDFLKTGMGSRDLSDMPVLNLGKSRGDVIYKNSGSAAAEDIEEEEEYDGDDVNDEEYDEQANKFEDTAEVELQAAVENDDIKFVERVMSGSQRWDDLGEPFTPTQAFQVQGLGTKGNDADDEDNKKPSSPTRRSAKARGDVVYKHNKSESSEQQEEEGGGEEEDREEEEEVKPRRRASSQWDDLGTPFSATQSFLLTGLGAEEEAEAIATMKRSAKARGDVVYKTDKSPSPLSALSNQQDQSSFSKDKEEEDEDFLADNFDEDGVEVDNQEDLRQDYLGDEIDQTYEIEGDDGNEEEEEEVIDIDDGKKRTEAELRSIILKLQDDVAFEQNKAQTSSRRLFSEISFLRSQIAEKANLANQAEHAANQKEAKLVSKLNKLTKKYDKNEALMKAQTISLHESNLKVSQLQDALKEAEAYASQSLADKADVTKQMNKLKTKMEKLKVEHAEALSSIQQANAIADVASSSSSSSSSSVAFDESELESIKTKAYKEGIKEGFSLGKMENEAMHAIEDDSELNTAATNNAAVVVSDEKEVKVDEDKYAEIFEKGFQAGVESAASQNIDSPNLEELSVADIVVEELTEQPSISGTTAIENSDNDGKRGDMVDKESFMLAMSQSYDDGVREGSHQGKLEVISLLNESKEQFEVEVETLNLELEAGEKKIEELSEQVALLSNRLTVPVERFMNGLGFDAFVPKLVELGVDSLEDLVDASLVSDLELVGEVGMSKQQVEEFRRGVNVLISALDNMQPEATSSPSTPPEHHTSRMSSLTSSLGMDQRNAMTNSLPLVLEEFLDDAPDQEESDGEKQLDGQELESEGVIDTTLTPTNDVEISMQQDQADEEQTVEDSPPRSTVGGRRYATKLRPRGGEDRASDPSNDPYSNVRVVSSQHIRSVSKPLPSMSSHATLASLISSPPRRHSSYTTTTSRDGDDDMKSYIPKSPARKEKETSLTSESSPVVDTQEQEQECQDAEHMSPSVNMDIGTTSSISMSSASMDYAQTSSSSSSHTVLNNCESNVSSQASSSSSKSSMKKKSTEIKTEKSSEPKTKSSGKTKDDKSKKEKKVGKSSPPDEEASTTVKASSKSNKQSNKALKVEASTSNSKKATSKSGSKDDLSLKQKVKSEQLSRGRHASAPKERKPIPPKNGYQQLANNLDRGVPPSVPANKRRAGSPKSSSHSKGDINTAHHKKTSVKTSEETSAPQTVPTKPSKEEKKLSQAHIESMYVAGVVKLRTQKESELIHEGDGGAPSLATVGGEGGGGGNLVNLKAWNRSESPRYFRRSNNPPNPAPSTAIPASTSSSTSSTSAVVSKPSRDKPSPARPVRSNNNATAANNDSGEKGTDLVSTNQSSATLSSVGGSNNSYVAMCELLREGKIPAPSSRCSPRRLKNKEPTSSTNPNQTSPNRKMLKNKQASSAQEKQTSHLKPPSATILKSSDLNPPKSSNTAESTNRSQDSQRNSKEANNTSRFDTPPPGRHAMSKIKDTKKSAAAAAVTSAKNAPIPVETISSSTYMAYVARANHGEKSNSSSKMQSTPPRGMSTPERQKAAASKHEARMKAVRAARYATTGTTGNTPSS